MCGIAAMAGPGCGLDDFRIRQLGMMLDAMASRGPDHEGKQFSRNVLLGHRLLRILPCAMSAQPMRMSSPELSIVFNGEIYNFRDLQGELAKAGVRFRTDTDTEVVLALYREHGVEGLSLLKGMFAFVIHDQERHRLITARDRFGQKPLYVFRQPRALILSSSLRAIGQLPGVTHELNRDAVADYLWTLDTPGDATLVRGVEHHPAGHAITWDTITCHKVADYRFRESGFGRLPIRRQSWDETAEEAEALLQHSVEIMTRGLPSVSSHLSGGIDSSLLALLSSAANPDRTVLFTCRFDWQTPGLRSDEDRFNEHHYAEAVARRAGTRHVVVRVSADHYRSALGDVFAMLEEPKGNAALAHALLADAVSTHARVCLSGEGADELFGGYIWKLAAAGLGSRDRVEDAYFERLLPCQLGLMRKVVRDTTSEDDVRARARRQLGLDSGLHPVDALMNADLERFLAYLLGQADKLAGYHSIEGRYPFLYDDLADFAFRLPREFRYVPGAAVGKPVLTAVARKWLPAEVVDRPKVGFVGPEGSWYRAELWDIARGLAAPSSRIAEYVEPREVAALLDAHRDGTVNARKLIWGLLSLNAWLEAWWP